MDAAKKKLRDNVRNRAAEIQNAEVIAVDETEVTVDVRMRGGTELYGISLRVFIVDDDAGIFIYPRVGSYVEVVFLDGSDKYPRINRVQDWTRLVFKRADGFRFEMTDDNRVLFGWEGNTAHPIPWGDKLLERIEALEAAYDEHTHGYTWTDGPGSGDTDPPVPTAPATPPFNSGIGFIEE